jgi:hypothetical protein
MSLRIQKSWIQLGNPQQPGTHSAPGVGKIIGLTQEHIDAAARLGGNPTVVLANSDSSGMVPQWEIVGINGAN